MNLHQGLRRSWIVLTGLAEIAMLVDLMNDERWILEAFWIEAAARTALLVTASLAIWFVARWVVRGFRNSK